MTFLELLDAFFAVFRLVALPLVCFGWGAVLLIQRALRKTGEWKGPWWADPRIWLGVLAFVASEPLGNPDVLGSLAARIAVLVAIPFALGLLLGWRVHKHTLANPELANPEAD